MCSISIVTDLSEHGWFREQDCLKVAWDSPENLQKVQRTVDFLTQGCQCKTGCTTLRCGCTKEDIRCGPSCHCINCKNTKSTQKQSKGEQEIYQEVLEEIKDLGEISDLETSDNEHEILDDLNREIDCMMEDIFGVPF